MGFISVICEVLPCDAWSLLSRRGNFLPLETDLYPNFARLGKCFLTLETGISANFDVRKNVVPPWRVRQAHSGSHSPVTSQNVNAKQSTKVASSVRFRHILHIFRQGWEKLSITTLREGLGNPILVSKICNIHDSASLSWIANLEHSDGSLSSLPQCGVRFY